MKKLALNVLAETPPSHRPLRVITKRLLLFFFAAVFALIVFAGDASSKLLSNKAIDMILGWYGAVLAAGAISFLVVCWRRGRVERLVGSLWTAGFLLLSLWAAYSSGEPGVAWQELLRDLAIYFFLIAGPLATGVVAHWRKRGWAIAWIFLSMMFASLPLLMLLWIPDRYWDDRPAFSKGLVEFFNPYPAHLFRRPLTFRTFVTYVVVGIGIGALLFWFLISLERVPLK